MSDPSLDIHELFNLEDKVALVTGGSRGIGYMMAQGLLQAGAKVYITARTAEVCQQAADELSQYGLCESLPADINDAHAREKLVSRISDVDGKLDILINNAGTAWGDRFEDHSTRRIRQSSGTQRHHGFRFDQRLHTITRESGMQGRSRTSDQHRIDRRATYPTSAWHWHLRIHRQQSRRSPFDTSPGGGTGVTSYYCQRNCPRVLSQQDDRGNFRAFRRQARKQQPVGSCRRTGRHCRACYLSQFACRCLRERRRHSGRRWYDCQSSAFVAQKHDQRLVPVSQVSPA